MVAQAPVPTMPLDGFDASDLPGSLDRLARFNRASAKTHTGIYRDLAILHRPTEVPAILGDLTGALPPLVVDLVRAIEQGRWPPLTGEPRPARGLRAGRAAGDAR